MLKKIVKRFLKEESGQGMVEYVILITLIVIAVIVILKTLGGTIKAKFQDINNNLQGTSS